MGYRVKPFTMSVRNNSTQEFVDVGLLGSDVDGDIQELQEDISELKSLLYTGRIKMYETIENMIADFKQEDVVCYVSNSSAILSTSPNPRVVVHGNGNFYAYSDTEKSFEYALTNGGYAILILNTEDLPIFNDPINTSARFVKTAYSYCGVNNATGYTVNGNTVHNVRYASNNGPYFEEQSYLNGIQCSNFVNCALHGLSYEKSRLANPNYKNYSAHGGYKFYDDEGNDIYPAANEMAHYAAIKGLFRKTSYLSDAEVGDVLFFKNYGNEYESVNWNGIIHTAVVIGKGKYFLQVAQAGAITQITGFSINVFYPGADSDAVNIATITENASQSDRWGYFDNGTLCLFGIARFPLHFDEVNPSEILDVNEIPSTSYSSGSTAPNADIVPSSLGKRALFGIIPLNGYVSLINNNVGLIVNSRTVNSAYGGVGINFLSTYHSPSTGGLIVVPYRRDGDTNLTYSYYAVRLNDVSSGSTAAFEATKVRLYK